MDSRVAEPFKVVRVVLEKRQLEGDLQVVLALFGEDEEATLAQPGTSCWSVRMNRSTKAFVFGEPPLQGRRRAVKLHDLAT
jgi:hypothetical protein